MLLSQKVDENTVALGVIQQQTQPLQEIADGVRGLRTVTRLVISVAGVVGAVTVILQVMQ